MRRTTTLLPRLRVMAAADMDRAILLGRVRQKARELHRDSMRAAELGDGELSASLRTVADELDAIAGRAEATRSTEGFEAPMK